MVDLNDVLLFTQVVEAGSFAEAARRLGRPANSVSRRVQELEASLGLQLMQRSTRRLVLTDAGSRLYDECAVCLSDVLQFTKGLTDTQHAPSGNVRFAATADFLDGFRGEWIEEFFDLYPDVKIELLLDDHRTDLLEHGIDFAFRGGLTTDPQLAFEKIGTVRRILVASPRYLARRGEPETIAELKGHDCLPLIGKHPERSWRFQTAEGEEVVEISGRFSASTIRGVLLGALNGFGIAMIPEPLAKLQITDGQLREILPEAASQTFPVYAVHRANTRLTNAATTFRAFVAEKLLSNDLITPLQKP